jgi:hypothetical protein
MPPDDFRDVDALEPAGFSDSVAFHILFRRLRGATCEKLCEMIRNGEPLFGRVGDEEWPKWQRRVNRLNLAKHVTEARFRKEFQERRPDIYEAALAEPLGPIWFTCQVASLRINLGIDTPAPVRYVRISGPLDRPPKPS